MLLGRHKEALSSKNLEDILSKLVLEHKSVSGVTFGNAFNPGVGRDYAFTGVVSGLEKGATSLPFKGEKGVYVVRCDNCSEADQKNLFLTKGTIQSKLEGNAINRAQDALYESAESADYRYKF